MKRLYRFIAVSLIWFLFSGFSSGQDTVRITLVESVPVETILDMPDIPNTLPIWEELFTSARKSIEIETFYVSNKKGESLEEILQLLVQAAARGVKVRIISDAGFYQTYPKALDWLDSYDNIEVRLLNFNKIAGGVVHCKYFIVDRREVFLGSQNFDWRALSHIHELGIRINSPVLAACFARVFEYDWRLAGDQEPGRATDQSFNSMEPLQMVYQGRLIQILPVFSPEGFLPEGLVWDEPRIIELIDQARQEVFIQLLTYSLRDRHHGYYDRLDNALRRAAARGVKVRLLCSDWSKSQPTVDYLKSLAVFPGIEVKLSTIPPYSGGFIPYARVEHCKYLVVDGNRFWLGTSNWSYGYFYNSRNVGVIIQDQELGSQVRRFFLNSWESPYAYLINPCQDYQPPRRK